MKRTTIIFMIFSGCIVLAFLEGVGILWMKIFYAIWCFIALNYVCEK